MESNLPILCIYDGEIICCKGTYQYKGGRTKSFVVNTSIDYGQLLQKIYGITKTNSTEFDIILNVLYPSIPPSPPAEISDNDDVATFIVHQMRNCTSNIAILVTKVPSISSKCKRELDETPTIPRKVARTEVTFSPTRVPLNEEFGSFNLVSHVSCTRDESEINNSIDPDAYPDAPNVDNSFDPDAYPDIVVPRYNFIKFYCDNVQY